MPQCFLLCTLGILSSLLNTHHSLSSDLLIISFFIFQEIETENLQIISIYTWNFIFLINSIHYSQSSDLEMINSSRYSSQYWNLNPPDNSFFNSSIRIFTKDSRLFIRHLSQSSDKNSRQFILH